MFSPRFLAVLALFIGCLIAANIIAVKLVVIWGMLLPAVTYGVVNYLKRREGIDVHDGDTRFNPFAVAN